MKGNGITLIGQSSFKSSLPCLTTGSELDDWPLSPSSDEDIYMSKDISKSLSMEERTCEICGTVLTKNQKKFCSKKCDGAWKSEYYRGKNNPCYKAEIHERRCEVCGEFLNTGERFCSNKCRGKGMSGTNGPNYKPEIHERTCEFCGNSLNTGQRFCSRRCHGMANRGENSLNWKPELHERVCEICGEFLKKWQEKYCSKRCYGLSKVNKIDTNCDMCGRAIQIIPFEYRTYRTHYCSMKCQVLGQTRRIDSLCEECGRPINPHRYIVERGQGRFCSTKCKGIPTRGEMSSNWRGGTSFEAYGIGFNKSLKARVRERDDYTCQYCGITETDLGEILSCHHINYTKTDNREENLISLCRSCHTRTGVRRYFWEAYFKMKIQEKDSIQSRLHIIREVNRNETSKVK